MDWSLFFKDPYWVTFGILGQVTFGARFFYQWLVSERAGRSVVPNTFWWLSIIGSIMIFIYAVHEAALAFMIPTFFGLPVYIRNLMLIRRTEKLRGA